MTRARGALAGVARLAGLGGLRADLPLRGDADLAIPDQVFKPQWREFDPYVGVDRVSWNGDSLRIEGWAYVPSVDIGRRRDATKVIALVPRGRRRPPLVLPARQVPRPDLTQASGQDRYRYDWAGFRCDIPARLLRIGGFGARPGAWDCVVLVRGRGVWRPARLHAAGPPPADPGEREVAPGLLAGVAWTGGRLQVRLRRAGSRSHARAGRGRRADRDRAVMGRRRQRSSCAARCLRSRACACRARRHCRRLPRLAAARACRACSGERPGAAQAP